MVTGMSGGSSVVVVWIVSVVLNLFLVATDKKTLAGDWASFIKQILRTDPDWTQSGQWNSRGVWGCGAMIPQQPPSPVTIFAHTSRSFGGSGMDAAFLHWDFFPEPGSSPSGNILGVWYLVGLRNLSALRFRALRCRKKKMQTPNDLQCWHNLLVRLRIWNWPKKLTDRKKLSLSDHHSFFVVFHLGSWRFFKKYLLVEFLKRFFSISGWFADFVTVSWSLYSSGIWLWSKLNFFHREKIFEAIDVGNLATFYFLWFNFSLIFLS